MDKKKLKKEYQIVKDQYTRLGKNIVEALKTFLDEQDIQFLDICYRIKTYDSIIEKIARKNYKGSLSVIEDICGIRIICYYASDINKIGEIIDKELVVIEKQDKSDLLGLKEFAYRSKHYIVKINDDWLAAPNFRKLDGLKSEIQIRTILMHSWAEIEHKLNYKSDAQVPDKFQRKLFRLSAKLEEADEQFEELKIGIDNYKNKLFAKIESTNKFNLNQDFNIYSFHAFIKFNFPNIDLNNSRLQNSFEEFSSNKKGFKILDCAINKLKSHINEISEDLRKSGYFESLEDDLENDPFETLAIVMDIVDNESFKRRVFTLDEWRNVVVKWREKIK